MLTVDIVSDFACPWCFIGGRRLTTALGARLTTGGDATVRYHPFQLNADTPPEGTDLRDYLRARYGDDPEAMFAQVEKAARESGLLIDFAKIQRLPNTLSAHLITAAIQDPTMQRALAEAIFTAYFLEGRDISNPAVLGELAAPFGLAAAQVDTLLSHPKLRAGVREIAAAMSAQGISGVPYFIFNQRFALSGAQPLEVFRQAIAQADAA